MACMVSPVIVKNKFSRVSNPIYLVYFFRSIIFFIISIMAFVWRTGTIEDASQTPITSHDALAPRIIVTLVLSLGLVYLILIRSTFQRYGTAMDRAWRTRVLVWMHHSFDYDNLIPVDRSCSFQEFVPPQSPSMTSPHSLRNASPPIPSVAVSETPRGRSTSIKPISTFIKADDHPHPPVKPLIKQTKILGLSADDPSAGMIPSNEMLIFYQMTKDEWEQLSSVRADPNGLMSYYNSTKMISPILTYRKFFLPGTLIVYRLYKILSITGIRLSSANVELRLYYVKNLA